MIDLKGYKIILGSKSPYRLKLLQDAGYDPEVMAAEIDEKEIGDRKNPANFAELPLEIAKAKRDAILRKIGEKKQKAILITCDQVSIHDIWIMEKPANAEEIRRRLDALISSIIPLQFRNGMTVTNLATGKSVEECDSSLVMFRKMPPERIEMIANESIFLTCASGVMIEHPLYCEYAIRMNSTLDSNIGLPVKIFERLAMSLLE